MQSDTHWPAMLQYSELASLRCIFFLEKRNGPRSRSKRWSISATPIGSRGVLRPFWTPSCPSSGTRPRWQPTSLNTTRGLRPLHSIASIALSSSFPHRRYMAVVIRLLRTIFSRLNTLGTATWCRYRCTKRSTGNSSSCNSFLIGISGYTSSSCSSSLANI